MGGSNSIPKPPPPIPEIKVSLPLRQTCHPQSPERLSIRYSSSRGVNNDATSVNNPLRGSGRYRSTFPRRGSTLSTTSERYGTTSVNNAIRGSRQYYRSTATLPRRASTLSTTSANSGPSATKMATDTVEDLMKKLKVRDGGASPAPAGATPKNKDNINILLLGETGVGKSTFINSLANYIHHKKFKTAQKNDLLVLIPTSFSVAKGISEQVMINVGSNKDKNEYLEVGASATQGVKSYVFPMGDGGRRVRLIDTPGMGDTKGVEQDDMNCENILHYLSELEELHAIVFLMKPTNTRLTVLFEYCMKQILTRLEKSAVNNIIFLFTNTRGTNYTAGDTFPCLRKMMEEIKKRPPHVEIPLKTDNIFCVDNEAFRFLAAVKNGIEYDEQVVKQFADSWKNSSRECWRMISYIEGDETNEPLKPHKLKNTISINDAQRMIARLVQPLADISHLIDDNLYLLTKHEKNLLTGNNTLAEMKQKLYIPFHNLQKTQMTQPATVCTSKGCAEIYKVGEMSKWHYKTRCHDPCYLTNVPKDMIGDPALQNCAAMANTRTCTKCGCDYLVHIHVYYMTKIFDDKIEDPHVKQRVTTTEQAQQEILKKMNEIQVRKDKLIKERDEFTTTMALYAHFLQHNAITPFNDSYSDYIQHLIIRERSLGLDANSKVIDNFQLHLERYKESKRAFDEALRLKLPSGNVTAQTILASVENLYQHEIFGSKLRELMKSQKNARKFEHDKGTEYIHPKSVSKPNKNKEEKSKEPTSTKTNANTNRRHNFQARPHDPPPPYPGNPARPTYNNNPPYHNYNNYPQHNYYGQPNYQPQFGNQFIPPQYNPQATTPNNANKKKTKKITIEVDVDDDGSQQPQNQAYQQTNTQNPYQQQPGYGYGAYGGGQPPYLPRSGPGFYNPGQQYPPGPAASGFHNPAQYPPPLMGYPAPGQYPQHHGPPNHNNYQNGARGRGYKTNFKQNAQNFNKTRSNYSQKKGANNPGNKKIPENKKNMKKKNETDSDDSSD